MEGRGEKRGKEKKGEKRGEKRGKFRSVLPCYRNQILRKEERVCSARKDAKGWRCKNRCCNRDPWAKSRRELLINGAYEPAGRTEKKGRSGRRKVSRGFMKIAGKVGYVTILDGTWMWRVLSVFILVDGGTIRIL